MYYLGEDETLGKYETLGEDETLGKDETLGEDETLGNSVAIYLKIKFAPKVRKIRHLLNKKN